MSLSNSEKEINQISEQPVFKVEFTRNKEDAVAWNNFVIQKNINNSNLRLWLKSFLICFLATIITVPLTYYNYILLKTPNFPIPLLIIFSLIFLIIYTILGYFLLRLAASYQSKKQAGNTTGFLEKTEFNFYEDKLSTKNINIQVIFNYTSFKNLYENQDYLFLAVTKIEAAVLPKKFFSNEQVEFIKSKIKTIKS